MARITVEQTALTDLRFQTLARLIHRDRDAALGLMVGLWNQCQELERHSLTREEITDLRPDKKGLAEALLASQLATEQGDGSLYIRGTNGRIEWLKKARESGREGGRLGGRLGGRPKKPVGDTPGGNYEKTPPSPSPSPAPSPAQETPPTPSRKRSGESVGYSEAFLVFWNTYPKRTGKGKAWDAWRHIKSPPPQGDVLITSLEAQKKSEAWQKDGGQFIPLPSTWINQRRWEDEVFKGKPTAMQAGGSDSMQAQLRAIQAKAIIGGQG